MSAKRYLGTEDEWKRLAAYLAKEKSIGLDTEFIPNKLGVDQTVTMWSAAAFLPGKSIRARGFYPAVGYCMPPAALPYFRDVLESTTTTKYLHNAPADTRSIYDSAGITLRNARCTLQYARVAIPNAGGYGLKQLAMSCLGKPARPGYKQVIGYQETTVKVTRKIHERWCRCGVDKCKKRKGPEHKQHKTIRFVTKSTTKDKEYSQLDFKPGHERWGTWCAYAIEDAVDALELASFLDNLTCRSPGDPFGPEAQRKARSMRFDV